MSIWSPPPVSVEPEVELVRWRIYEIDAGTTHFVGSEGGPESGRVSSAIQAFDPASRIGVTRSGRTYRLRGDAGVDEDAHYVWLLWCNHNAVKYARDVSDEALAGTYFAAKH